jgi:hypothetical protein
MALVRLDAGQCRLALENDAEFFIQFFLYEELTHPIPEFHKEILALMISAMVPRLCLAIPRDHAKTTLAKLACLWYFLFSPYRFIIYVSNTAGIAVPATNDIIGFFESANFIETFGVCAFPIKRVGEGLYKFILPESLGSKVCILRALGAGQQVRGINVDHKRPQLAIVDDLEDNDNIATPELFMKLKKWVYGPFKKALDKFDHKIIWLGNMIDTQSMLFENCQSEFWHSRLWGVLLKDGSTLWPEAWPLEKLRMDYIEYQKNGMADIWFAEMMNMPMASGNGLIEAGEITYKPEVMPGNFEIGFLTVDLAISDKTWAHKTAITVHGWIDETFWQIVETKDYRGIDPIALFREIIKMVQKWHIHVIGIESVAYQASLQFVYPHLCLMEQIEGLEFCALYAGNRKAERLSSWAGLIKAGEYALTEGDFVCTQQLLKFDSTKKNNDDDTIDACASGPQMVREFSNLIWAEKNSALFAQHKVQTLAQIAEI